MSRKSTTAILWQISALFIFLIAGCSAAPEVEISPDATDEEIQAFAIEYGDEKICSRSSNCFMESACIAEVAEHKGDVNLCKKIKGCEIIEEFEGVSEFAQESCISDAELAKARRAAESGDVNECMALSGSISRSGNEIPKKEVCLQQLALTTLNPEICDLLNGMNRDLCLLGLSETNPELCGKMQDDDLKAACIS